MITNPYRKLSYAVNGVPTEAPCPWPRLKGEAADVVGMDEVAGVCFDALPASSGRARVWEISVCFSDGKINKGTAPMGDDCLASMTVETLVRSMLRVAYQAA